jgi:Methyltransferase FkbM domain
MGLWTRVPRGVRDRVTGVLPEWWWAWLHQLREIDLDREWQGASILRASHPGLAAPATGLEALRAAELRVHSQNGEDGILAYLLDRIGPTTREIVEFGIGDGSECCAANLILTFGWSALLLEADGGDADPAAAFYAAHAGARVRVEHTAVEPDTIDGLLSGHVAAVFDVLSVDIDGNDYWVLEALEAVRPRVIVVEYNASFGPERSVTIPYARGFDRYAAHASGFYHGASLTALARLGERKGYLLAGCDSRGTNAFLVDADAARDAIERVAPADAFAPLYERAHLSVEEQFRQIEHLPLVEV